MDVLIAYLKYQRSLKFDKKYFSTLQGYTVGYLDSRDPVIKISVSVASRFTDL